MTGSDTAADTVTLTLGGPAAGGTCVAHTEDATWFVRGGLPGESVTATVTSRTRGGRLGFATVVEVLEASADRVSPPCELAGECGGCDLQHVAETFQPIWKAQVLRDQLRRLGGIEDVGGRPLTEALPTVTAMPLLGWRTRFAIATNEAGAACFHAHRSDVLIPVPHCPVVVDSLQGAFSQRWPAGVRVHISESRNGPTVSPAGATGPIPAGWRSAKTVVRSGAERSWRVSVDGFWQSHRLAVETLVAAVRRATVTDRVDLRSLVDLYSGVGLFAGALVASAQPPETVTGFATAIAVEGEANALRLARRNLHDLPSVQLVHADVKRWVTSAAGQAALATTTAVLLDPPRAGAGPAVIAALAQSGAEVICVVACDGASLARDAKQLLAAGWRLDSLEAFDLFGMSHHVEAVARFIRA